MTYFMQSVAWLAIWLAFGWILRETYEAIKGAE